MTGITEIEKTLLSLPVSERVWLAQSLLDSLPPLQGEMSQEAEWAEARADLAASLRAGWAILAKGGTAVDAVEAAVRVMEDSVHFNAGYGAAFNAEGDQVLIEVLVEAMVTGRPEVGVGA